MFQSGLGTLHWKHFFGGGHASLMVNDFAGSLVKQWQKNLTDGFVECNRIPYRPVSAEQTIRIYTDRVNGVPPASQEASTQSITAIAVLGVPQNI